VSNWPYQSVVEVDFGGENQWVNCHELYRGTAAQATAINKADSARRKIDTHEKKLRANLHRIQLKKSDFSKKAQEV
jgi:hypothetical protein